MPRAPCALAMTEAEGICVSFRDQSADWSWESVIPLCKSKGERIATPVTGSEEIRVSFRDQSADWSWESVIPLRKSKGDADCHSQCAHWLRNDTLQVVRWGGPMWGAAPTKAYLVVRRGGALPLPRATARVAPTKGLQGVR